jgi:hypothetical protein
MVDRQGDQSQDEAAADRENIGPHQGRSSAAWRFLFALCCMPCMDREMNYDAHDVLPAARRHRHRYDDQRGHLRRSLRTAHERHRDLAGRYGNRGVDWHRQLRRLHGGRVLQRLVGYDELVDRALGPSHRHGRDRVRRRGGRLRGFPVLDLLRRAALTAAVPPERRARNSLRPRAAPA